MTAPTFHDVVEAAERIRPHVHRTPVFTSRLVDDRAGAHVVAKAENLQKIGAFKARGALNAVLGLDPESLEAGVATHSSGNHAQALAYAALVVGTKATIVMPDHAPKVKVEAVRALGADIVFCPQSEREDRLRSIVAETGASIVHPFDDPMVIAGQGTATLELLEDVPDLDVIVTPIGGGGLLSGATLVAAEAGIPTVGAEPEVVDDARRSLETGIRQPATGALSVGDGLLTGIGDIAFRVLSEHSTRVLTVTEDEILDATRFVVTRTKHLVEPSAATVFAVLFRYEEFRGLRVGVIVSGGNVDLSVLG